MILFYLALFLLCSFCILTFSRYYSGLSKHVLLGLVFGIVLGGSLQLLSINETVEIISWYNIVGNGYINLLKAVMMPLVFISILSAINKLESAAGIGRMSLTVIICMLILVMIAGFVGLATAKIVGLDASAFLHGQIESVLNLTQNDIDTTKQISLPNILLSLIPSNIFSDLAGTRNVSVIGVVIFALFSGIALLQIKKEQPVAGETLSQGIDAIQLWVMKMVNIVIVLTPYAVMALIAKTISFYKLSEFINLLNFIGACYLSILLMFIVHAIILMLLGKNPWTYFRTVWPVLVFAFVSRSSAASIPLAIESQKRVGVSHSIANLAASFGASMGQNGCAGIYPAIMVAMIAPSLNIDPFTPQFLMMLLPAIAIGSIGVAGVGGGGTFAALIVLSTLNFPVTLVGIFIAIEPLVDMGRTALNVNGSMLAGTISSSLLRR